MDAFEQKYGIQEDDETEAFHRSRRMFCIYQDRLVIAEPNQPYSHAAWFEKGGWMSSEEDGLMDDIPRGIIDENGDVYFYVGYDFEINEKTESVFFSHLGKLVGKLNVKPDARIFGGLIRQDAGNLWPPKKEYGKVKDYL